MSTEFDSNAGHPSTMRASQFVPGFKEALCMLGAGGQMTAVIPATLAYGVKGAGEKIGPNATLVLRHQGACREPLRQKVRGD